MGFINERRTLSKPPTSAMAPKPPHTQARETKAVPLSDKPIQGDKAQTICTRLDPAQIAKLDRIASRLGLVRVGRSAALRWVLDQHEE